VASTVVVAGGGLVDAPGRTVDRHQRLHLLLAEPCSGGQLGDRRLPAVGLDMFLMRRFDARELA
jgi:hypothetical protein